MRLLAFTNNSSQPVMVNPEQVTHIIDYGTYCAAFFAGGASVNLQGSAADVADRVAKGTAMKP